MIAHAAQQTERLLESALVDIIEEQAADAPRFVSVRQEKIAVAPFLVLLVDRRAERQTGIARRTMPMQDVFVIRIVRREVESTAEPPMSRSGARRRDQESDIAMGGRCVGIARMKHQGQTHGLERRTGNLRTRGRGAGRHFVAEDMGERHARPLEHGAVAQNAALAAAAFRPGPGIPSEFCPVDRFHGSGDPLMQVVQVALDRGCIHRVHRP